MALLQSSALFSYSNLAGPQLRRKQHLPAALCGLRVVAAEQAAPKQLKAPGKPRWFGRGALIPQRLLTAPSTSYEDNVNPDARPNTVYTLRFMTAYGRGAGLSEDAVSVMVCLVGQNGDSFLRRISPVNDPQDTESELIDICRVADPEARADCGSAINAAARRRRSQAAVKTRFQAGSVDEVCFIGPDLGPLASLLVAPEAGAWKLDEVNVYSSRIHEMDRFVCREHIGARGQRSAAFLAAVPPGAVVYGAGDSTVILTKEQASALHAMGMNDYKEMKRRLSLATAACVAGGSGLAFVTGGLTAALPFVVGGAGGLVYQWLLQAEVDAIPGTMYIHTQPALQMLMPSLSGDPLQRLLTGMPARLSLVLVMALVSVYAAQTANPDDIASAEQSMLQMRQVMAGVMGFMMYKLAVVGVSALPSPVREPIGQQARGKGLEADQH